MHKKNQPQQEPQQEQELQQEPQQEIKSFKNFFESVFNLSFDTVVDMEQLLNKKISDGFCHFVDLKNENVYSFNCKTQEWTYKNKFKPQFISELTPFFSKPLTQVLLCDKPKLFFKNNSLIIGCKPFTIIAFLKTDNLYEIYTSDKYIKPIISIQLFKNGQIRFMYGYEKRALIYPIEQSKLIIEEMEQQYNHFSANNANTNDNIIYLGLIDEPPNELYPPPYIQSGSIPLPNEQLFITTK